MKADTRHEEADERTWFGHPPGLTILFLTEMWSEFSFIGMRTLLVYYMTQRLLFSQADSSLVYGIYSAFVFLTPVFGGMISDRWLGRRRAVLIGGGVMAAGHFMMAFQSSFYPALTAIALGNGLFLPTLTSQINALYKESDPRKSRAYNIYYVGVNSGAFFAPLSCGTLGELFGWQWGFLLAGIGMVGGLIIYIVGSPYLPKTQDTPVNRAPAHAEIASKFTRNTYVLLACVFLFVVIYRTAYEQVGNTVALWAASGVDRSFDHWQIPFTWFQALNPLGIFLFTAPLLAWWKRRAARGKDRSALAKMATGAFMLSGAYLILAAAAYRAGVLGEHASWIWLALYFLILTAGELFILPVGLALFGRLAPERHAATMIAAWLSAAFFGNLLAGALGTLWSSIRPAEFFSIVAAVAAASGISLRALVPFGRRSDSRLLHGRATA